MADPIQSIADPNRAGHHGTELQIDTVNQWMRAQPWYQQQLAQWGQNPQSVKLSKAQSAQLMDIARAHGVDITNDTEVDPAGNLNPKGHKLRNTIIVAGIAAATIATMGAAGAFSGPALGAGSAAGGASGAASAAGGVGAGTAAATGGALAATPTVGAIGALAPGLASGTSAAGAGLSLSGAAAGGGSILGSLGTVKGATSAASKIAPILGHINDARAANQQATDITRIAQKNYELGAPGKRLDTSRKASLLANFQPVKAQWGGPGSGLRGEHVNFTGGFSNPDLYSPDTKALAQDVMHKQLLASLNGEDKLPDAGHSSVWDKILGGIGTGASILGAFA